VVAAICPIGKPGSATGRALSAHLRSHEEALCTCCATRPPDASLLLDTDDAVYALSPADAPGLLAALQERYAMGPSQVLEPRGCATGWLKRWQPEAGWARGCCIGGLLGVLILFGVLDDQFPEFARCFDGSLQ
jgi:hypothetical protein